MTRKRVIICHHVNNYEMMMDDAFLTCVASILAPEMVRLCRGDKFVEKGTKEFQETAKMVSGVRGMSECA